ncbi:MAG TPA: hypothetical protein VF581_07865 [Flavobacterium sp.]|jgi:hypothetical protein
MKAETVYTIVKALPISAAELLRLSDMLREELAATDHPKVSKFKPARLKVWTVAECTEHLLKTKFNKVKPRAIPPAML